MKNLLFFFSLLSSFIMVGQNLVPNPSFEDTTSCPRFISDFNLQSWYSPNSGSPDLFHTCSNSSSGAPQNVFGWQEPRTGEAYVGGHTSDFEGSNVREYIQCQLLNPMTVGQSYVVSIYISRADSATKACDQLGLHLSTEPISSNEPTYFPVSPQVVSPANALIIDDTNWVLLSDTIVAAENYNYLTIGVFSNDSNAYWQDVMGGWEAEAHYYYDDVSIIPLSDNYLSENSLNSFALFPNPSRGYVSVNSQNHIVSSVKRVYSPTAI